MVGLDARPTLLGRERSLSLGHETVEECRVLHAGRQLHATGRIDSVWPHGFDRGGDVFRSQSTRQDQRRPVRSIVFTSDQFPRCDSASSTELASHASIQQTSRESHVEPIALAEELRDRLQRVADAKRFEDFPIGMLLLKFGDELRSLIAVKLDRLEANLIRDGFDLVARMIDEEADRFGFQRGAAETQRRGECNDDLRRLLRRD